MDENGNAVVEDLTLEDAVAEATNGYDEAVVEAPPEAEFVPLIVPAEAEGNDDAARAERAARRAARKAEQAAKLAKI
jgi:hypothetical protein